MDEKQIKTLTDSINKNIETLKKSISEKVSADDLEAKFGEITEKLDAFVDDKGVLIMPEGFAKQQTQLDDIATQIKGIGELQDSKIKGTDEQMDIALKGMFVDDGLLNLKNREKSGPGQFAAMELKTSLKASPHLTTDVNSGVIETQTEPGVDYAPWRNTPIWNAIRKGTIGKGRDSISWWEETTRGDEATMITEGTGVSAGTGSFKTWTKQSMDIQMLMDFTKVSGATLEDFEYIKSEINDLLTHGIPRKRETELWSGAGTTTYLKGIEQYAQTFAKPANYDKVSQPNDSDVLMAAILQVNNGYTTDTNKKGFLPSLIMVNPGTIVNMQSIKNSETGQYIIPPFMSANGVAVGGVKVIGNLDLDAGEFLVGDFSQAKAYMKRNMRISFHYENDKDVLSDLVLVLASMRLAGVKITAAGAYGFVKGTFAAGKVLIEDIIG